MFKVISDGPLSLSGRTLVMPAVSVGAVPTLALDLLLSSSQHQKIGWIYTDYFYPFVGNSGLGESCLSHPLELFDFSPSLVVLQIRSLCKNSEDFIDKLVSWCKEVGIHQLIVAASNWDEMKAHESDSELFYVKNSKSDLDWDSEKRDFDSVKEFLKGAGLCKRCMKADIPVNILFVYGKDVPADVPGAFKLAEGLSLVLNLSISLSIPSSWQEVLVN
jgi:proteasome assembly chaperone 2